MFDESYLILNRNLYCTTVMEKIFLIIIMTDDEQFKCNQHFQFTVGIACQHGLATLFN